jgi:predicted RNA-binding Zn ribbon-like protein
MVRIQRAEAVRLLGDALCLDFSNSGDWVAPGVLGAAEEDVLRDVAGLAVWGARVGLLGNAATPDDAELGAVRGLRQAVNAVLAAIATGAEPAPEALGLVLRTHAEGVRTGRLELSRDGGWRPAWPDEDVRRLRFAVAADTVTLLGDPVRLGQLKLCSGRDCGWLFLDRGSRRRWCQMQTCGSRDKMRRMYARRKAAESRP